MDNALLFVFGLVAFLAAVGPLAIAFLLNWREHGTWWLW
jgi:hypothetical protein